MSSFEEGLATARTELANGNAQEAYLALRPLLDFPGDVEETPRFVEAFGLFAEVAQKIAGDELAEQIRGASGAPDDPQRLYDAAYALYEQQLFPIAATLLSRANSIAPGQAMIVTELSANLEAMMAYPMAALVIELSGLADQEPMCAYLHAFNALMSGDLDVPRARLPALASSPDPQMVAMSESIAAMLARADAIRAIVPLDEHDLTGWHAAINGTVLLHESPHGFDEGMNGRYAYLGDSPGLMREGLERLRAVIAESEKKIERVVAPPDRASRILARAAAKMLSLPLVEWSPDVGKKGLFVAWSLEAVGDVPFLEALQDHAPDQILFAHASSWVEPFFYAPDVTTVLHQNVSHPWTGGALTVDPETRGVKRADPDPRDEDALAALITSAEIADPSHSEEDEVIAIVRAMRPLPEEQRGGLFRTKGPRVRQRAGSPVQSNRFL